jgi:NAD(P)-dependent dehydrogenase (short-subunit alcohol dehydrogenase family)
MCFTDKGKMELGCNVALVISDAQGIGKAIAARLAQEDADIVVHAPPHDLLVQNSVNEAKLSGRCSIISNNKQENPCDRTMPDEEVECTRSRKRKADSEGD